jgi:hypothetical protein
MSAALLVTLLGLLASEQTVREVLVRATEDFRAGRVERSLTGFDRVAAMAPGEAPHLWQRGIAQYYVGRFRECRDMFVSHRTVNPADVENAAWHFLCVARAESAAVARKQLLPVGPDARVPMRQVYQMFKGDMTPEQVLAAAGSDPSAQFFARLYVGLFLEVTGDAVKGREHIAVAAQPRYAAEGGYMHDVALVHMKRVK